MDLQTVGLIITLILGWTGFLIGVIKWLLDRNVATLDEQIKALREENKALRAELAELRAEMPLQYVRLDHCKNCREEWLRVVSIIDQKLMAFGDRMSNKIDELRKELYGRS